LDELSTEAACNVFACSSPIVRWLSFSGASTLLGAAWTGDPSTTRESSSLLSSLKYALSNSLSRERASHWFEDSASLRSERVSVESCTSREVRLGFSKVCKFVDLKQINDQVPEIIETGRRANSLNIVHSRSRTF
jgi:hypothetical protein